MNDRSGAPWNPRRLARLAGMALLALLVLATAYLGPPWFRALVPEAMLRRLVVRLLIAAQVAYGVLLVTMPVVSIALAIVVVRQRRRGVRRPWPARGLAMGVGVLLGLGLAEAAAWSWLAWSRVPMPALKTRFLDAAAEVTRFPDAADDRTVDILVLGESSARGVPYHEWLSVGEIVAWKLREAFPDRRFPVEYLARPGLTLAQVHFWMGSLERRPDLVILYAGHNEFQMRHHWGHPGWRYADESPPARVMLASLAAAYSPLCRFIQQTSERYRMTIPPAKSPGRQLVDVPVYTEAEYAERRYDFHTRLEAMAAYCERVGALLVLVSPPGNDADFEPNRSFLPRRTPKAEREAFAEAFRAAQQVAKADPTEGIAAFEALLTRQPGFAEAHFRLARLLESLGRRKEADRHYVAARDCDGFPMRCTSDFLDAYNEVASRHPGAILVDGPAVLRGLSPRGTAGDNFFTDGLHPSLIGYTGIAQAILRGLHARGAFGWPTSSPAPVVTAADYAEHFGMDAEKWKGICEYAAWFYQQTALIRFDQAARSAKAERYRNARDRIGAGSRPSAVQMPGVGTQIMAPVTGDPRRIGAVDRGPSRR